MKTKTINLYSFDELAPHAQHQAIQQYIQDNQPDFLSDYLHEIAIDELANEYKDLGVDTATLKIYYILSSCQGDGVMFEAKGCYKGYDYKITHEGRYYHSNSKNILIYKEDETGFAVPAPQAIEERFNHRYMSLCKAIEKAGYAYIDEENDETFIAEYFNTPENEIFFTIDGQRD